MNSAEGQDESTAEAAAEGDREIDSEGDDNDLPVPESPVSSKLVDAADPIEFSKEFHVKEWESLRKEVEAQIEHTRKLELAAVAGLGAFYAWFTSSKTDQHQSYLLYIPIAIVFLGALRSWSTLCRIKEIALYIRAIERTVALKTGSLMGWDTFRRRKLRRSRPFLSSAIVFWVTAAAISITALILLGHAEVPVDNKPVPTSNKVVIPTILHK